MQQTEKEVLIQLDISPQRCERMTFKGRMTEKCMGKDNPWKSYDRTIPDSSKTAHDCALSINYFYLRLSKKYLLLSYTHVNSGITPPIIT